MVDKTMMGDKCAELVRAAMIGALAVTLGNPTAVYAAEEETADPGQIGIEIAGEAAVGAASFCVEEDAAEEAPAEAVTEPEGTQNDEMEEESGSEGKEDETVPEEPEPQEPDGGENAGMTEGRRDRARGAGKSRTGRSGRHAGNTGKQRNGWTVAGRRGRYFQRSMAGAGRNRRRRWGADGTAGGRKRICRK